MPTSRIIGLAANQPTYRLLIVEDQWESKQLLVELLVPLGFEVYKAKNGQEGVELWERYQPHLIFMDMQMPVMDGYTATQKIRALEKQKLSSSQPPSKIISLTASAFEEQRSYILSIGCDDFIYKPFREELLLNKLAEHLGISYIYQERIEKVDAEDEQSSSFILDSSSLQVMCEEWITQLHRAASMCSKRHTINLIEQIPQEQGNLAQALTDLVHEFQFEKIVQLCQGHG
jgi:CheY-like chemotaxis protein